MIDYQTFQQIRLLHDQQGLNAAQIARTLNLHWETARKWVRRPKYERRASPPRTRRPSKLDAYKGTIVRLLESHPFTAAQLLIAAQGRGLHGQLHDPEAASCTTVRPRRAPAFLTLHFAPGQCAQVDWGSWGTIRVGSTRRALSFFVMVLCCSRRLFWSLPWARARSCGTPATSTPSPTSTAWSPPRSWCDNLKTAVLSRPMGGPPVLNPAYARFCPPLRLRDQALRAASGQRKGPRGIGRGICEEKLPGRPGHLGPGRAQRGGAAVAGHGGQRPDPRRNPPHARSTMFAEEKPRLRPLPAHPYDAARVGTVRVSNRCRVTVDTNRYSVPAAYASAQLTLKLYADRLRLFDGRQARRRACALFRPATRTSSIPTTRPI